MRALVQDLKSRYHVAISPDYVERLLQAQMHMETEDLYRRVLNENLREVADVGMLPYGIASQVSSTLPHSVLLQVCSSRDATQPLRPCADGSGEISMLPASHNASPHRLVYLVLSDGHTEIPALELNTLSALHGVPIPGEKLLIKAGAEVRNGCVILTNDNVVELGGEVSQLKQEYLARHRRIATGSAVASTSLDGAPRFEPLQLGSRYHSSNRNNSYTKNSNNHNGSSDTADHHERNTRGGGNQGGGGATHHRNHANQPNMRESRHGRGHGGESGGRGQGGRGRGRGAMRGFGDAASQSHTYNYSSNAHRGHHDANNTNNDQDSLPAFNTANFPPLR